MTNYADIEKIENLPVHDIDECGDAIVSLRDVRRAIAQAKTDDVVQVVRCKDCIHRDPEDKKCDCLFQARGGIFPMDDDDFCSYGERWQVIDD